MEFILVLLLAQTAEPTEATSPQGQAQQQTTSNEATGVWTYGQDTTGTTATTQKVYGYRVQIFATIYKDKADKIRAEVQQKVEYPVYVEEIAPFYKVRIGDFQKREDAEQFLAVVQKSLGYSDAFVAETIINVQQQSQNAGQ